MASERRLSSARSQTKGGGAKPGQVIFRERLVFADVFLEVPAKENIRPPLAGRRAARYANMRGNQVTW